LKGARLRGGPNGVLEKYRRKLKEVKVKVKIKRLL
jgi:hypothetical protein